MANNLTELQQYRIAYICDRKKRILKRLKEIRDELQDPGILYETHQKLTEEKNTLCKEFDGYADEYRSIIQARQLYLLYKKKTAELKKKWGFQDEEE